MRYHALAWLLLAASSAAEVVGTIALRYADGFTRLWPSLAVGSLYALAIWLMSLSVRHLEVGVAYAVWAGVDTAITAAVGMLWFGESFHSMRLISLAFVVAGVICLNFDWRQFCSWRIRRLARVWIAASRVNRCDGWMATVIANRLSGASPSRHKARMFNQFATSGRGA